jgi:hypothetical protein
MRKMFPVFCCTLIMLLVSYAGASTTEPVRPRTAISVVKAKKVLPLVSAAAAANDISITGYFKNQAGQGLNASDLANALVGQGVAISNVTSSCADDAAGGFLISGNAGIGLASGILLSTGSINNVVGPNVSDSISIDNSMDGDADLDSLIPGYLTFDACILEFDFIPQSPTVSFRYVFSSEEYNEWVGSDFNDVFGFFINGVNCAKINNSIVSINSINAGSNSAYYVNNEINTNIGTSTYNTEMDGFTRVMTCSSAVQVGQTNHLKLAIADAGDAIYDANVFIGTQSLISELYGLSLSPDTLTGSASCGTAATYELDLQNIGSASDSYNLTISNAQWSSVFTGTGTTTATVGPLPSLSAAKVAVNVTIPANACSGSDTFTVTATSVASPSKTATASISTASHPVPLAMIGATPYGTPYGTLQAAYDAATLSGAVIMLLEGNPGSALGTLTADAYKSVTIKGGYNAAYSANSGSTVILGPVTIESGMVSIDNVGVR